MCVGCGRWVKELFRTADRNGDGCLNLKEIVGLMKHLNIEVDLDSAKETFQVTTRSLRVYVLTGSSISIHACKTFSCVSCKLATALFVWYGC